MLTQYAKLISGLCCLAMYSLAVTCQSAAASDMQETADAKSWTGTYQYVEDAGINAAGTAMIIVRTLKVRSKSGTRTGTLKSMGYQTDETILCNTKCSGNKLTLLFKSYADGRIVNQYDVSIYKPGAPLLTLEKQAGRKPKILTTWQEFKLNDEHAKNGIVYFEKVSK